MQVETELKAAGLTDEAITAILATMQARSLDDLAKLSHSSNPGVTQLRRLFELAEGYGFQDWLAFDASVVRGLAYYTGQAWHLPAFTAMHFVPVLQLVVHSLLC